MTIIRGGGGENDLPGIHPRESDHIIQAPSMPDNYNKSSVDVQLRAQTNLRVLPIRVSIQNHIDPATAGSGDKWVL